MRYFIEGRAIPERIDLNLSKIGLELQEKARPSFNMSIEILKSKIFVHVDAPPELDVPNLKNIVSHHVGSLIHFLGFYHVLGISYELDSILNVDTGDVIVFGVEGHVFAEVDEFKGKITFIERPIGVQQQFNPRLLRIRPFSRALFELRNSIRYPDYTAHHCRLAIEAIRNAFDPDNENNGWSLLRNNLHVSRDTLVSFQDIANKQRHSKNEPQNWKQRQRCMQIAWEICHRFTVYAAQDNPAPLPKEYPVF